MPSYPYTLEDFARAYEATGLRAKADIPLGVNPFTGDFACGCPQGVLALHRSGMRRMEELIWAAPGFMILFELDITREQYAHFAVGFDEGRLIPDLINSEAYQLGRAARKRFLPDEWTEEAPALDRSQGDQTHDPS